MVDLMEYDEYLEATKEGLGLKADAPESIKKKLKNLDDEYFQIYGEHLFSFDD